VWLLLGLVEFVAAEAMAGDAQGTGPLPAGRAAPQTLRYLCPACSSHLTTGVNTPREKGFQKPHTA